MIKQTMEYYKSMYKYELADAAGVSMFTFRRWLEACEEDLIRLGYKKNAKVFNANSCEIFVREVWNYILFSRALKSPFSYYIIFDLVKDSFYQVNNLYFKFEPKR